MPTWSLQISACKYPIFPKLNDSFSLTWSRFYENSRTRHRCYYANRKYCFIWLFMYQTQHIIASQGHISSLCSQVFWNRVEYYRAKSATDVNAIQIYMLLRNWIYNTNVITIFAGTASSEPYICYYCQSPAAHTTSILDHTYMLSS